MEVRPAGDASAEEGRRIQPQPQYRQQQQCCRCGRQRQHWHREQPRQQRRYRQARQRRRLPRFESSAQEEGSGLHIAKEDDASSLTQDKIEELDKQDERMEAEAAGTTVTPTEAVTASDDQYGEKTEPKEEELRKLAEKLLAWASYRSRSSLSTGQRSHNGDHNHSSVLSLSVHTSGSARMSLLRKMIETKEDGMFRRWGRSRKGGRSFDWSFDPYARYIPVGTICQKLM